MRFTQGKALTDYLAAHPECRTSLGVKCCHCGSASIFIRKAGQLPTKVLNSHICRVCGQELYRSET